MMLRDNPQYRIVFNGASAWKELTGQDGWELVVPLREDFIRRHPGAVQRWIAALQDVQTFIKQHVDEAEAIVVRTVKLPPGVFKEAVASGRINVVFSVDLFNEGIDIPQIDTLLMLRPTDSPLLFIQQLGRGLRRAGTRGTGLRTHRGPRTLESPGCAGR